MSVGKFLSIAERCTTALPELSDHALTVEFSPGNGPFLRHDVVAVRRGDGRVVVDLAPRSATCKPCADVDVGCNLARPAGSGQACCA